MPGQEYRQAVEEILSIPKFTKEKHDFGILRSYLQALGSPEQGIRIIHVAGTNGKGSVTRMLGGFLQKAGRHVGCFLSPHLVRINERILVNGAEIPDDAFAEGYRAIKKAQDENGLPQLTFFEVLFILALLYFHTENVQDAVLETGLGGRLDATSSIPADLFVITEIGMDHEEYLGSTIEEIAGEKAGIITGDAPVVFHTQEPKADPVIRERAKRFGCKAVLDCGKYTRTEDENGLRIKVNAQGIDFSFRNDYDMYNHVLLPTRALYQVENAVTAITAAPFLFPEYGKEELQKLIRAGLAGFFWEGRMEEVRPGLYVDGAHNPSAAEQLVKSISLLLEQGTWKETQLIFGASGDKDIKEVLQALAKIPWSRVIFTRYEGDRAASLEKLEKLAKDIFSSGTRVSSAGSLILAMKEAQPGMRREDVLTVVSGSLYLVGEMKRGNYA